MKTISVLVLTLLLITGCATGLEKGEDGFYHFESGDKFDSFYPKAASDGSRIGDLFLKGGDVYHRIRVNGSREHPNLTFNQQYQIGITLSNNIRLLGRGFDGLNGDLEESAILFPNGWMIKLATDIATHFSKNENKLMFEGEVKFGILVPNIEKYYTKNDAKGNKQAKALLGKLFPRKDIDFDYPVKINLVKANGDDIDLKTFDWPVGNFQYVKTRMKTTAPIHKWPTSIEHTKGLKAGYYGLEKDGLPFGPGSFLHDDGVLTVGNFKEGVLEGMSEQLLTDGSSLKGIYVKGYKNGLFTQTAAPVIESSQQIANRIEREKELKISEKERVRELKKALKKMSAKEREKAIIEERQTRKAKKALKNNIASDPTVSRILLGTIWQGNYERDVQTGWWQKTLNNKVIELRLYDKGKEMAVVSLGHSGACSLHSISGEVIQFSSSDASCNGALFSAKTGTLYQDVVTNGGMIVEATVTPVYPRTFEGLIASGTFTGRQYSTDGGVEYVGDMSDGKRNGNAKCNFEGGLEPCQFTKGERVDELYLARVTANKIQRWNDQCDSNISSMRSTNWLLYNEYSAGGAYASSCTVDIYKSRFDEAYRRDQSGGVEDDASYVEVLGPVSEAQKCIDGESRMFDAILKKTSTNASHLRSNQCLDIQPINQMSQSIRKGVEFRRKELAAFQNYVSKYRTYGESLERARKKSLRDFKAQVARDTHNDIMNSLSSIQRNVNQAMKISNNEFNSIMQTYEINKPKQIAQYQINNIPKVDLSKSTVNSSSVNASSPKIVSPRRADQLLAAYKRKCLSDPANSWKNNGCVYTVPYDGRFNCSDSTGLTCKTGEAWNANNADPKKLTAIHSGATSFGSASNKVGETTENPTGKESIPIRVKEDKGESMPSKNGASTQLAAQLYNKAADLCRSKHDGRLAQFITGKAYASGSHGPFTCNIVRTDWYQCNGELTIDCILP